MYIKNMRNTNVGKVESAWSVTMVREHLQQGLKDDGWPFDWTAIGTAKNPDAVLEARIVAKARGVFAGAGVVEAVSQVSQELGLPIETTAKFRDGDRVKPKDLVAVWKGPARSVLALERPFLNIVSYMSGIATATAALVDEVEKAARKQKIAQPPRVTSTRKTLPGYRDLAVYGVLCGGGFSHRVSLSGGVLIKENHIAAAGGVEKAVTGARAIAPHGLRVEIEVTNHSELEEAVNAGADVVMLDNFTAREVEKSMKTLKRLGTDSVIIEVSGGISLESIGSYVIPGVNVISSGSLTHSVKALDLSLLVVK